MDIAFTVTDVTITNDRNKLEVYRLLHFSLMSHRDNLGVVAVHLYTSSRTIQIQGSAVMPNGTKIAKWFTLNFVLIKFREQAEVKKYLIKNTNEFILDNSVSSNSSS